mmetsp:Transcript_65704/g.174111  ORF Transcript_65704/g.174111 Transcript_65704/m.174111 type:complete len:230 (+) Transcript_65704:1018-1707(+)
MFKITTMFSTRPGTLMNMVKYSTQKTSSRVRRGECSSSPGFRPGLKMRAGRRDSSRPAKYATPSRRSSSTEVSLTGWKLRRHSCARRICIRAIATFPAHSQRYRGALATMDGRNSTSWDEASARRLSSCPTSKLVSSVLQAISLCHRSPSRYSPATGSKVNASSGTENNATFSGLMEMRALSSMTTKPFSLDCPMPRISWSLDRVESESPRPHSAGTWPGTGKETTSTA